MLTSRSMRTSKRIDLSRRMLTSFTRSSTTVISHCRSGSTLRSAGVRRRDQQPVATTARRSCGLAAGARWSDIASRLRRSCPRARLPHSRPARLHRACAEPLSPSGVVPHRGSHLRRARAGVSVALLRIRIGAGHAPRPDVRGYPPTTEFVCVVDRARRRYARVRSPQICAGLAPTAMVRVFAGQHRGRRRCDEGEVHRIRSVAPPRDEEPRLGMERAHVQAG